ncbi:hypothetical protein DPMN_072092 [Dreissena polymorpha]|uniref:Uncharacterized protein n=1 Tax=Dreissena polymorpha TaxID=45954 RepID=A0A9D3Z8V5_DREPO|nr:hypothetical protein DPMN_072092 [Dreissena polymorpha]
MDDYWELLRNFEVKKRTIDADSDELVTYKVPFKMLEFVLELKPATLKQVI